MGILDFDDDKILAGRRLPTDKPWHMRRDAETNFIELQALGRQRQSQDFEDSSFADRKPKDEECEHEEINGFGQCRKCNQIIT